MSELDLKVTIDGDQVSKSEIQQVELSRYFESAAFLITRVESNKALAKQVSTELNAVKSLVNQPDSSLTDFKKAVVDLKLAIGTQQIKKIFTPETDYMSKKYNQSVEQEPVKYNLARTIIEVHGLSAKDFVAYFASQKAGKTEDDIRQILIANPDHYLSGNTKPDGSGDQMLIEAMGFFEKPMCYALHTTNDPHDFPDKQLNGYPNFLCVRGIDYQTGHYSGITAFHQFKPTEDGFIANLNLYFSAKYPLEMVRRHKLHLAIEFSNWLRAAYNRSHN